MYKKAFHSGILQPKTQTRISPLSYFISGICTLGSFCDGFFHRSFFHSLLSRDWRRQAWDSSSGIKLQTFKLFSFFFFPNIQSAGERTKTQLKDLNNGFVKHDVRPSTTQRKKAEEIIIQTLMQISVQLLMFFAFLIW